jgi:hypothetical protein
LYQLRELIVKPGADAVWSRFYADHLRTLVTNFLTLDRQRQKKARQLLLYILVAAELDNRYFVNFLRTPTLTRSFPKAAVELFLDEPFLQEPPIVPGFAKLFSYMIIYCEDAENGHEKACIGAELRARLKDKIMEIKAKGIGESRLERQGGTVKAWVQVLAKVEHIPGYARTSREHLRKLEAVCASADCKNGDQPASLTCSRCRTVVYCNQACQKADWARGHKMRCFQVQY